MAASIGTTVKFSFSDLIGKPQLGSGLMHPHPGSPLGEARCKGFAVADPDYAVSA